MIEAIMYSAIGFLTATLLALLTLPAVWRRAVRLTRKRIESAIPVSIAEVQADKDEQRAIFAVGIRRLEMDVAKRQALTAAQYGEITRQAEELRVRQETVERLSTELETLQTEHGSVVTHRDHLLGELNTRTRDLEETRAALLAARAELTKTREAFEETSIREEGLKIDHIALTTLRDTLKDRIGELDRHLATTNAHLMTDREALRTASESLTIELRRNREMKDELAQAQARLAALDEEVNGLKAERAALTAEVATLEARVHAAEKAGRETQETAARESAQALDAQRAAEAQARETAETVDMLRAEQTMLQDALAKAREDRAALQEQIDRLAPLATAAPDEAADTALLRERISDIAAEVAHLTSRLEGPGSPIDTLLASHDGTPGTPPTLADRILALKGASQPANGLSDDETRPKDRAAVG